MPKASKRDDADSLPSLRASTGSCSSLAATIDAGMIYIHVQYPPRKVVVICTWIILLDSTGTSEPHVYFSRRLARRGENNANKLHKSLPQLLCARGDNGWNIRMVFYSFHDTAELITRRCRTTDSEARIVLYLVWSFLIEQSCWFFIAPKSCRFAIWRGDVSVVRMPGKTR